MKENEEKGLVPKRKPNRKGKSRQSALAVAMSDPSKVDVSDLVPQSCKDQVKKLKGSKQDGVSKYTPGNLKLILQNVTIGMTEGRAAQLVGISPQTLSTWKKQWGDLSEALAGAHARCEERLVGVVNSGMQKHPRLALEVLERKFPKDWASHSKHQVAGVMMQTQISPEMLTGMHGARAERDASGDKESPDSGPETIDI